MNFPLLFADKVADIMEIVLPLLIAAGIGLYKLFTLANQQKPPAGRAPATA